MKNTQTRLTTWCPLWKRGKKCSTQHQSPSSISAMKKATQLVSHRLTSTVKKEKRKKIHNTSLITHVHNEKTRSSSVIPYYPTWKKTLYTTRVSSPNAMKKKLWNTSHHLISTIKKEEKNTHKHVSSHYLLWKKRKVLNITPFSSPNIHYGK